MHLPYRHQATADLDGLYVVTSLFNPQRYHSRYGLYDRFKIGCERVGVPLMTVEVAFGDRPFERTTPTDPLNLQLRTRSEIWLKEAALNLAISRLPRDWKYVAWVDADVEFVRHDWPMETVHQLQHYSIVQMFQHAVDMGPRGEVLKTDQGFVWTWQNQGIPTDSRYYGKLHPGYSWAARRDALNDLGGLIDFAILGAADRHMAFALVGKGVDTVSPRLSPAYKKHVAIWEGRATRHIRQNIGYVPGTLLHHFHGKKKDRRYQDRWQILLRHGYDPELDLKRDWQELYQLSDAGLRMRNDIRAYFGQRHEDSIDL